MRPFLVLLVFAGCNTVKHAAGDVGGTVAEYTVCPLGLIECGHVFQCEAGVEICIDDDDHPEQLDEIESTYGACAPTPRHQGLCSYCCGENCGRGCNAFSGCWCSL